MLDILVAELVSQEPILVNLGQLANIELKLFNSTFGPSVAVISKLEQPLNTLLNFKSIGPQLLMSMILSSSPPPAKYHPVSPPIILISYIPVLAY